MFQAAPFKIEVVEFCFVLKESSFININQPLTMKMPTNSIEKYYYYVLFISNQN